MESIQRINALSIKSSSLDVSKSLISIWKQKKRAKSSSDILTPRKIKKLISLNGILHSPKKEKLTHLINLRISSSETIWEWMIFSIKLALPLPIQKYPWKNSRKLFPRSILLVTKPKMLRFTFTMQNKCSP